MSVPARVFRADPTVPLSSSGYWEARAERFAGEGEGFRAVCSYGMPTFYNRAIDLCQRLALAPWLRALAGTEVLDVGCGVGRWSRRLAGEGASVTGIDLSAAMLAEAAHRARAEGVGERCTFAQSDVTDLDLGRRFETILAVTVLQHVIEPARLRQAVDRLAAHLAPGGRIVLLEAMPSRPVSRCDTAVFTARTWNEYSRIFSDAGLEAVALTGVDPAPLKILFLPYYKSLPPAIAKPCLAAVTALALPWDVVLGRRMVHSSWHKVAVLERTSVASAGDDPPRGGRVGE